MRAKKLHATKRMWTTPVLFALVSLAFAVGAIPAGAVPTPSSLTFGGQLVGTTSSAQIVTDPFCNQMFGITGSNPSDFTGAIQSVSGSSCTVAVTFTPSSVGVRTATLSIGNDSVPLSGTGTSTAAVPEVPWAVGAPLVILLGFGLVAWHRRSRNSSEQHLVN